MANVKNDDMITVYLPLEGENGENYKRVGVNGKMYQIPRGRNVRVPRPVYDVLRQSRIQHGITTAMIDANKDVRRMGL